MNELHLWKALAEFAKRAKTTLQTPAYPWSGSLSDELELHLFHKKTVSGSVGDGLDGDGLDGRGMDKEKGQDIELKHE